MTTTPDSEPAATPSAGPDRPRRSWVRRVAGWVLRIFAATLLALVGTLLFVLYTQLGTRTALRLALDWYDGAIPGDARVESIEGSLGTTLVLRGVTLRDAEAHELVAVDSLTVQVAEGRLLTGHLDVFELAAKGVRVDIPAEGPGFASLAPPAEPDEEPPPPTDLLGPDLPVRISAALSLEEVEVSAAGEPLVRVDSLELEADADGTHATASLSAALFVPLLDLEVASLSLAATWHDPVASIDALEIDTSQGQVDLLAARLDASTLEGSVEELSVLADPDAWSHVTGLPASLAPALQLSAEGGPRGLTGRADVIADGDQRVTLTVEGQLEPDLAVDAKLVGDAQLSRWLPDAPDLTPHVVLHLGMHGEPGEALHARARLQCDGCLDEVHPLLLEARLHAHAVAPDSPGEDVPAPASAWLALASSELRFRDTQIQAEGWSGPGGVVGAALRIPSSDLAQLAAAARPLADVPALRGRLRLAAACSATLIEPSSMCSLDVTLDEGDPVREARLAVSSVTEGRERAHLRLHRLQADAPPLRARLRGAGADVSLSSDAVAVDGLDLAVRTRTGRGRVEVEGRLAREGEGRLAADIDGLELQALAAVVPSLDLRGLVDGRVTLEGSLEAPRPSVSLAVRALELEGRRFGDVTLDASHADGRSAADVTLAGGDFGTWSVRARGRADLSLQPVVTRLRTREPITVDVEARGIDLSRALAAAKVPTDVAGDVSLELGIRGTPRRPRIEARVDANDLYVDGRVAGDLHLDAAYEASRASATLRAEHPNAKLVRVEAQVPVVVSLLGAPRWRRDGEHLARIQLEAVDLRLVEQLTDVPLSGRADLDVTVQGTVRAPRADALARWRNLAFDGRRVASGALEAALVDERLRATAHASGPAFSGLGLTADVPLVVDLGRGQVAIAGDETMHVVAALDGIVLSEVARWLPSPVDMRGHVDTVLELAGTPADPDATATVNASRLGYGTYALGDLDVTADLAAGDVRTTVAWQQDARRRVHMTAKAGVEVDLARGHFAVDEHQPYVVGLEVPHIDRKLLEPFVELPTELEFASSLHGIARGPTEALTVAASMRGHARAPDGTPTPLRLELDATTVQQRLQVSIGKTFSAELATEAALPDLQSGRLAVMDIPLDVRLDLVDAPLAPLGALVPTVLYDTRGTLDLHATVGGTVGSPVLDGAAELRGGAVTVVPLRQRLEGIVASLAFANDHVELSTLALRSGGGTLSGKGEVALSEGKLRGSISLDADRLPASSPGLPRLEVTSDIDISVAADDAGGRVAVTLAGSKVDVVSSNVEAAKRIPSSPRVEFVARLDTPGEVMIAEDYVDAEETDGAEPFPLDFAVTLTDPLRIRGPAIDMEWSGEIRARQEGSSLATSGELVAERGFFELLTNRFDIDRGSITIPDTEELQLFVDLAAETRSGEFDVLATLRGPLPRPELRLTSAPSLTESQIFTLLLTGTADFDQADPDQVETQAAALLAAVSSPALQRQLNDRIGVDRIGVGVGETTNQPILSVGKNITRKLYAETKYHQNAPENQNQAELRVRYNISPRWSLETFFGDAAEAGLDVFWGKAFDGARRRKAKLAETQ